MDQNPASRMEANRLHFLVSFHYWRGDAARQFLEEIPKEWNVMLDSGAFTNFTSGKEAITVDDYAAFCLEHKDRFWRIINLDKIGDPEQSHRNLMELHRRGVPALPVFQRGESASKLREMAKLGSPVCIGGISQHLGRAEEQAYIASVMKIARSMGIDVHLLGAGRRELIRYRPFSADNSTWVASNRFGRLDAWYKGKNHIITKRALNKGTSLYVKPDLMRTRVLASYGLTWADMHDQQQWFDGYKVHIANIRSWIRVARDLAKANSRYVFAGSVSQGRYLLRAWRQETQG